VVLNALLWTAGAEVPEDGVSCTLTDEELNGYLRKRLEEKSPEAN